VLLAIDKHIASLISELLIWVFALVEKESNRVRELEEFFHNKIAMRA
jgi:hypothetical protein